MSYLNNDWDDNIFPLAYLITIRTFGTWLYGDERGSVDRHGKNIYGTPDIQPTPNFEAAMLDNSDQQLFLLNKTARPVVEAAIREFCLSREYALHAVNVRTNHVHTVIAAQAAPEKIANSMKSYATRKLRSHGVVDDVVKVWSRGGSRRYLWKPRNVEQAIEYVLYGQGDVFWK